VRLLLLCWIEPARVGIHCLLGHQLDVPVRKHKAGSFPRVAVQSALPGALLVVWVQLRTRASTRIDPTIAQSNSAGRPWKLHYGPGSCVLVSVERDHIGESLVYSIRGRADPNRGRGLELFLGGGQLVLEGGDPIGRVLRCFQTQPPRDPTIASESCLFRQTVPREGCHCLSPAMAARYRPELAHGICSKRQSLPVPHTANHRKQTDAASTANDGDHDQQLNEREGARGLPPDGR